jgi:uroporphyrinogen-III synthase
MPDEQAIVGKRLLMLRPEGVCSKLEAQLQAWGAIVEPLHLTKIVPLEEQTIQQQLGALDLTNIDWVVFTSHQGVYHGWQWVEASTNQAKIAVVGQATQFAVEAMGQAVSFCAERASGKGLAEGLLGLWTTEGITASQSVLWVGSALASDDFSAPLEARGHRVLKVPVYTTQAMAFSAEELVSLQQQVDAFQPWAIVVTSGSGVKALTAADIQVGVGCTLVSLGENTTNAILGFEWGCGFVEAQSPTAEDVLAVLKTIT